MKEDRYTLQEAADILEVSKKTLDNWIQRHDWRDIVNDQVFEYDQRSHYLTRTQVQKLADDHRRGRGIIDHLTRPNRNALPPLPIPRPMRGKPSTLVELWRLRSIAEIVEYGLKQEQPLDDLTPDELQHLAKQYQRIFLGLKRTIHLKEWLQYDLGDSGPINRPSVKSEEEESDDEEPDKEEE